MPKIIKYFLITVTLLVTLAGATLYTALSIINRNPGARMVLIQGGFITPSRAQKEEITITVDGTPVPVFHYYTRFSGDRFYVFIHGLTPLGYKHPALNDLAKALVDSTGMHVFIPDFTRYVKKNQNMNSVIKGVAGIYMKLQERYPGHYRGFGSCIGGTILMNSMLEVPREKVPEKIFLYGPYNKGKGLVPFLQEAAKQSNMELDFLVRLTLSSKHEYFNEDEKKLIEKAMLSTRPGLTDKTKMKQILGQELFRNISVFRFTEEDMKDMDVKQKNVSKHLAETRFFIIHSKNDRLIPYQQGKSLAEVMKIDGLNVSFIGTEIFSHTKNEISVTGIYNEALYLVDFFNELFMGDVKQ